MESTEIIQNNHGRKRSNRKSLKKNISPSDERLELGVGTQLRIDGFGVEGKGNLNVFTKFSWLSILRNLPLIHYIFDLFEKWKRQSQ
jgi:hypothetical protein